MSLNESIIKIRVELQKKNLKKSGENKYAGFRYFELADFMPTLHELMYEEGVNDYFTIENDEAVLTLKKKDEKEVYKIPFILFSTPLNKQGKPSMQDIQYLGALDTYYRRYLYGNAFGITDGDVIDGMDNSELDKKKQNQENQDTDYKSLLRQEVAKRGWNIHEYAKKNSLNPQTTQQQAKQLYDTLINGGGKHE